MDVVSNAVVSIDKVSFVRETTSTASYSNDVEQKAGKGNDEALQCCYTKRKHIKWLAFLSFLLFSMHWSLKTTSKYPVNVPPYQKKYLLNIFTTFSEKQKKFDIYKTTLMNWVHLDPGIRVIVFTDSSLPSKLDFRQNLTVHPMTKANEYGYLFLKYLYHEANKVSTGEFIGYCNADILFSEGLKNTLTTVMKYFKDIKNTSVMVVGNRRNVDITYSQNDLYEKHEVKEFAKKYAPSTLNHPKSSDYFFIKGIESFPWHKIKDVVVGRLGFDGYLIEMANLAGVNVVDGTKTIIALHQTDLEGNYSSKTSNNKGVYFNRNVTKMILGCGTSVEASKFYSDTDEAGRVRIFQRNKTAVDLRCKRQKKKNRKRKNILSRNHLTNTH